MMTTKILLNLAGIVWILLWGVSCNGSQSTTSEKKDSPNPKATLVKPMVVCTTTMISDLARNLACGRFEVVGIMKPKEDPHIYKPRPGDAVTIGKAKILLRNGLHLEGTLTKIVENNLPPGALNVALAEDPRVKPLASEQFQGAPDPHCWFNVTYFMVYAERCRDAFIQADPDGKELFVSAAQKYLQELEGLHQHTKAQIATIPKEKRVLITSHDAFQYFGQAYAIEVHSAGFMSTEAEPKPQDIENLIGLISGKKVKAVFIETSVPEKFNTIVKKISARTGAVIGGTLYSDSLGEEGAPEGTYVGMVRHNVATIVKALK